MLLRKPEGRPHHRVLAVACRHDLMLSAVAPLGLAAAAAGTALVVDLDPEGPRYPGGSTLAALCEEGPRRSDLSPTRGGVAVLGNGGIGWEEAAPVLEALIEGWPRVVLRVGREEVPYPTVPVVPLLPGFLAPAGTRPAVYQPVTRSQALPGPGLRLAPLTRSLLSRLLAGELERGWRWVRSWRPVWGLPWG
jgi:hypothetical protein